MEHAILIVDVAYVTHMTRKSEEERILEELILLDIINQQYDHHHREEEERSDEGDVKISLSDIASHDPRGTYVALFIICPALAFLVFLILALLHVL